MIPRSPDPDPTRPLAVRQRVPGLLLIGATGRGAGKTLLAGRILARFGRAHPLVAVKVTAVGPRSERDRPAPDAGPPFDGPFSLTEADDRAPGADTTRLVEAGATRVLWLRVRADGLTAGGAALRTALGAGTLAVAESNSLRTVVDPDVFLMVDRPGPDPAKPTADDVAGFVDRRVRFDGEGFEPDPDRLLAVAGGRWRLAEPATGIILAGGHSQRMGRDKRALVLHGARLLDRIVDQVRRHVDEVILGTGDLDAPGALPVRVVADRAPGQGPLMGLASCLAASGRDRNLVVGCDLPDLPPALVERLLEEALDHEAVVPVTPAGHLEPLLAVYRRRLLPDAERLLAAGERRLSAVLAGRDVRRLPLADLGLGALPNLNTPADLETYLSRRR